MPDEETTAEETSAEESTEEINWQERAEAAEASAAKLTNENKSLSGRARAERIDELVSMVRDGADQTAALTKTVNAFAVRTARGETEEIPGDLAKINAESADVRAVTQYETGYSRLEANLMEAFRDEAGEITVDVDSPDVVALTGKWTAAKGKRDLMALSDLVTDAHKLVQRLESVKSTASTETAREEEKSTAKAEKAKAGVNNLSIPGPAAASGSGKSWDQMQKTENISDVSADDYFKAVAAS